MTKIKKIDIGKFGSFSDFTWNSSVSLKGNAKEFLRLNIIYGRNYSGKTTLSRIFRCFETKKLPENYDHPSFTITTDSSSFNVASIYTANENIRVYNKDFIKNNLSFLEDHSEGDIKTFAIIGGDNQQIEEKIRIQEVKLGSVESESGLAYKKSIKFKAMLSAKKNEDNHSGDIEKKLKDHANNVIKINRTYGNPTYNITKIKSDIKAIRKDSISLLSEEDVSNLKNLIREETLDEIFVNPKYQPKSKEFHEKVKDLVEKKIEPTSPIQELLNDAVLQAWVKSGIDHHKGKRKKCAFCSQSLPANIWKNLDNHFNKQSEELDKYITKLIGLIESEMTSLENILGLSKDQFYISEKSEFETCCKEYDKNIGLYKNQLSNLLRALNNRKKDIFSEFQIYPLDDDGVNLTSSIEKIYDLVETNNKKTKTL